MRCHSPEAKVYLVQSMVSRGALSIFMATSTASGGFAVASAEAATRYCADVSPLSQRPDLRQGDDGWCVQELQSRLNKNGYPVRQTHYFGPATAGYVKQFQTKNRLPATGVAQASSSPSGSCSSGSALRPSRWCSSSSDR